MLLRDEPGEHRDRRLQLPRAAPQRDTRSASQDANRWRDEHPRAGRSDGGGARHLPPERTAAPARAPPHPRGQAGAPRRALGAARVPDARRGAEARRRRARSPRPSSSAPAAPSSRSFPCNSPRQRAACAPSAMPARLAVACSPSPSPPAPRSPRPAPRAAPPRTVPAASSAPAPACVGRACAERVRRADGAPRRAVRRAGGALRRALGERRRERAAPGRQGGQHRYAHRRRPQRRCHEGADSPLGAAAFRRVPPLLPLVEDPQKTGDFGVDLRIDKAGGKARSATPAPRSEGKEFKECVVKVFEGIDFLKPRGGTTTVSYSLRVHPRQGRRPRRGARSGPARCPRAEELDARRVPAGQKGCGEAAA